MQKFSIEYWHTEFKFIANRSCIKIKLALLQTCKDDSIWKKSIHVVYYIKKQRRKSHHNYLIRHPKSYIKSQHSFLIKVMESLGLEAAYFNTIKAYVTNL